MYKENIIDEHNDHQPDDEQKLVRTMNDASLAPRRQTKDHTKLDVGSLTPDEIKEKMKELYEKTDSGWRCLVCDHTNMNPRSSNIRQHVETHMDGLSYTCNLCDKKFRSQNILSCHKYSFHKY